MPSHDDDTLLYRNKREQLLVYVLVAVGVFALTFGLLFLIDFLPEKPKESATEEPSELVVVNRSEEAVSTSSSIEETESVDSPDSTVRPATSRVDSEMQEPMGVLPAKIIFDKFDREITVNNPQSRAVADLDEALLSGVVRHPDSASLESDGTMFLFGHSSYLPHVVNKNFQAFNGIQELTWGDRVRVQSAEKEYVYRVDRVYQVRASEAEVEIERGTPKLTLATCNSFGSKDDRYIVEATLVDEYTLN